MADIKECKKEFKKLVKSANKIYKTRPIKFKENQLEELVINSTNSIKIIASNDEACRLLKNKFLKTDALSTEKLLLNSDYFNALSKIVDLSNFNKNDNKHEEALSSLIYYMLSYRVLLYPHLKQYIDNLMDDKNEVTFAQQQLIYAFSYWKFCYEQDIKDNKAIDEKLTPELLDKYFRFEEEIKIRKAKIAEEKNMSIRKEKAEKFKNESISLDVKIEVNDKYKLSVEKRFQPCFEDFVTRFGNSRMAVDKSKNLGDFKDLISKIAYENNIYALTKYLLSVINGNEKHVSVLDDVIIHMLTKVKYNLKTLEFAKVGTECSYCAFCEYLMYQFGIIYKKDVNKARYLLLTNAHLIKTPLIYERPYFNKYILKAIFMHYKDYVHFDSFDYILNYILPDIKYSEYVGYDAETIRYVLNYAKEKNNIVFIGKLLNELDVVGANIFDEFNEEKAIYDKMIDEERKKKEEEKRILEEKIAEENRLKEEEFNKRKGQFKFISNEKIDQLKTLSIEELSSMEDSKEAMYLVASHYFNLGNKDKENYLISAKFYEKCAKAGAPYQLVNVGICYGNYSSSIEDEYAKLRQDIFREKMKEYVHFAFRFILSKYKYNPIEEKEKEEIYNFYLNNEEKSDYDKSIIKIAYNIYKANIYEAFSEYKKIKYQITNSSILEAMFIEIFSLLEKRNFEKFSSIDNKELADEAELVYRLGCNRVGLLLGLAYYKGNHNDFSMTHSYTIAKNRIFDRDYKKAYEYISKHYEEYGGNKNEYYQNVLEEIKNKL